MNIHKSILHEWYPFISLAIILLTVSVIYIGSLESVFLDEDLHLKEFEKNKIYDKFPVTDIDAIHHDLLEYYKDRDVKTEPNIPFFNKKETSHLLDVKNVLIKLLNFKTIALALILLLVFVEFFLYPTYSVRRLALLTFGTGLATLILTGITVLIVNFNYDWFFIKIHNIFFEPGTWIFNTVIVDLYPYEFFFNITQVLITKVLSFGIIFIVMGLMIFGASKKWE